MRLISELVDYGILVDFELEKKKLSHGSKKERRGNDYFTTQSTNK